MNKKMFTVAFFMTAMIALPLAADNDKDDAQSESSDNSSNTTADNSSSSSDSKDADNREVAEALTTAAMERGVYY